MSALLSTLSPSQSHMIHSVGRMSLNSNQGKIIASVVFFLKNFKICALTILCEKWWNCLCASCYSTKFWLANHCYLVGFKEGMLFVIFLPSPFKSSPAHTVCTDITPLCCGDLGSVWELKNAASAGYRGGRQQNTSKYKDRVTSCLLRCLHRNDFWKYDIQLSCAWSKK